MPRQPSPIARCPQCGITAPRANYEEVARVFGWRCNGTQPQSRCNRCRSSASSANQRATRATVTLPPVANLFTPINETPRAATVAATANRAVARTQVSRYGRTNREFNHIYRLAIEMEGGFTRPLPVNCVHNHDDGHCNRSRCVHSCINSNGECALNCEHNPQRCCTSCAHAHSGNCFTCLHSCTETCSRCVHDCRRPWDGYYQWCQGGAHGDSSIRGVRGTHYEVCTPKQDLHKTIDDLRTFVENYAPDSVSDSCGTHFHVSLNDDSQNTKYRTLAEYEFYEFFMLRVKDFAQAFPPNHPIHERIQGDAVGPSYYCQRMSRNEVIINGNTVYQNNRYRAINYAMEHSLREYGMATIEFRIFSTFKYATRGNYVIAGAIVVNAIEDYLEQRTSGLTGSQIVETERVLLTPVGAV